MWNIFKTETQNQLKLILVWSIAMGLLVVLIFALFESLQGQREQLQAAIANIPKGLEQVFGARINALSDIALYFNTQFMTLFLITNSILGAYTGAGLGREVSSYTLSFLLSKPVYRTQIYFAKLASAMVTILGINLIVGVISVVAASVLTKANVPVEFFISAFAGAILMQWLFVSIGQALGVSIGDGKAIAFATIYSIAALVIDALSRLDGVPEFLKWLTPYQYLDLSYISDNHALKQPHIWAIVLAIVLLNLFGVWWFNQKDITV